MEISGGECQLRKKKAAQHYSPEASNFLKKLQSFCH
jgi:hypothetical protein